MKKISPKIIFEIQEFRQQGLSTRSIQKVLAEQSIKVSLGSISAIIRQQPLEPSIQSTPECSSKQNETASECSNAGLERWIAYIKQSHPDAVIYSL